METVKEKVGTFLGLSQQEVDIFINLAVQKVGPVISTLIRIGIVLGLIYCLVTSTTVGIFLIILGYYVVQLEERVSYLEKKVRDNEYDQRWGR